MSKQAQILWKLSPFLYRKHAHWRAWQQEMKIAKEQAVYQDSRYVNIAFSDSQSIETVRRQLLARLCERRLTTGPKSTGNIHIIYASRPSNWEPHNIPAELSKIGKVTTYYYSDRGYQDYSSDWLRRRCQMKEDLLAFIQVVHRREPVDVFVGYLSGWQVAPETIEAIGQMGIVTFGFHWDDKMSFRGQWAGGQWSGPAAVASAYDLNLTNSPDSIPKYEAEGGLAIFWPEAANPEHFKPMDLPFEYDVSFIGACYGYRPIVIEYLRHKGIKVETFGPGWPNGPVSEKEMVEIYSRSRINLGFGGIGYSMKEQCLKGRDFEVPMCGGLYLTSENPDLHLVYDVGREIVTYRTKEDCLKMVHYFIDHPEEAMAIRRAARFKCLQEHTWEKRFDLVFKLADILKE